MISLNDSNREEALKYVIDLYTKFLSEPDGDAGKDLRQVHLKQMSKFTRMFNRKDEAYLVKEGLNRQSKDMTELETALKLRAENTELLKKGIRTKASDVITLDIPEIFQRKDKEEEPINEEENEEENKCEEEEEAEEAKEAEEEEAEEEEEEDEEEEEEEYEEPTSLPKKKLSNEELIENIKKIKDIADDLLYPTIESLILTDNINLSISLQEKLEYLGFDGYDKFFITNTTSIKVLINDVIYTFMSMDLNKEKDVKKIKFVINKISEFNEWNNFFKK